jgi:predicted DCC family thiol-disulfide oxidoreductase YuxK
MLGYQTQGPATQTGQHLLLYDGACGLCNGLVRAVLKCDRRGLFQFASLQSSAAAVELTRTGGLPCQKNTFIVIVNHRSTSPGQLCKASAALFVLDVLGWPWRAVAPLRILPMGLLDWGYDLIARNRHRISSGLDRCLVPRPEYHRRFLDSATNVASKPELRR